ncbi:MAG: pitrilysin family protein [Pseudomonadota bacterium]
MLSPRAVVRRGATIGAALFCGLAACANASDADEVRTTTLENGLKIIVWPDHDIPNVAMYNFVRAGGRNEVPGITGLSHFFEHMMFNGTATLAPGEFDRIMEANGGSNNAYTSADVTVYQDWFPSSALDVIFDLESDRFANLAFVDEVVESERGVVTSERRSAVDNSPFGALYEQTRSTAFVAHPYHIPVIGWPSDIAAWTEADLRDYYTTYYAPNNCTLVVVGDVDAEDIFRRARESFGTIPAQAPPPAVRTTEPEQMGERRLTVERDVQSPLIAMAYKSPAAGDPSGPSIDLLLSALASGESSRLYRALVEPGHVIDVSYFRQEGFDPGLTWLFLTLPQGADLADVETRVDQVIRTVVESGVSAAELARAQRNVVADFYRGLSTINGKASALGEHEVFHGGYTALFDVPSRYAAVSLNDVQAAAAATFDKRRRTVGILAPGTQEATP